MRKADEKERATWRLMGWTDELISVEGIWNLEFGARDWYQDQWWECDGAWKLKSEEDRTGAAEGRWKMRGGVNPGHGDSGGDSASTRGEGRGNRDREGREGENMWKIHGKAGRKGVRIWDNS